MAERPRTLIALAFRLVARWITSLFITLDPIGIIKEAVAEMKKYKARVDSALEGLNGARRALQKDIQTMTTEMGDSLRLAQAARSSSNLEAFGAHTTIAGRKERSIESTRRNLAEIERAIEQMKRVQRHVDNKILVAEEEAKDLERQFKSAQKVKAATGAAKKALGGSDLIRLKDDAADYVREFYANELGALETLTEMLEFGNTLDLQDIAFQQDGMARLAEIERMMNQLEAGPIAPRQIVPGSPTVQAEQRDLDPTSSRWTQHIREPRE
jgi:Zn-dependent M32 family carboxypeptidase